MVHIDLPDTNSAGISAALVRARRASGSPAMDMVLTLLMVADEDNVSEGFDAVAGLSREHPARILAVIRGSSDGDPRLDASIRVAHDESPESILMRMSGPLIGHAESAVLPLMLPDSPVVVWWPGVPPINPAKDPLGALGQRRLTSAGATDDAAATLGGLGLSYMPGDTDLAWTRATPWRAVLAASLDQVWPAAARLGEARAGPSAGQKADVWHDFIDSAEITASADNPVAILLKSWLSSRLNIPVYLDKCSDTQIKQVRVFTTAGTIDVSRVDQQVCQLSIPGTVPRQIPLGVRPLNELLAEDLRRLDADQIYGETLTAFVRDRRAS